MVYKFGVLVALLAVAEAGYVGAPAYPHVSYYGAPHGVAPAAVVSQQANIFRSPGNLAQVSTYSKTIDTPYSSVSKSDVRVSNDALAYPHARGYVAPGYPHGLAYSHGYAAPAGFLGVAYSAAPAAAHFAYGNGYGLHYSY